jgi:hypothetical protein
MPSTINASTAAGGGIISSADSSGVLELQTAGTTAISISSAQRATLANDASISGLTVGKGGGAVATNVALGQSALAGNSTGLRVTAIGNQALLNNTASENTAIGARAMLTNTSGANNTAVGRDSMYFNTTGGENSALGLNSLIANTTGSNNTAIGRDALQANTTASNNTAVGYQAGYSNTTGAYNIFMGYQAGYTSNSGSSTLGNTCIGSFAGYSLTTGTKNTFVGSVDQGNGKAAGYLITTGSANTILGNYTGNQGGLDIRTASNYIVLSDGDGTPQVYVQPSGNTVFTRQTFSSINAIGCYQDTTGSAANVFITSGGSFVRSTSSRKYKTEIQDAAHGLADVLNLRSVTYKGTGNHDGQQVLGGLIAEEVHEAGLTEFVQYADDGTPDALAYGHMVSLCIKAIQELKAEVDSLKQQLGK